MLQPTTYNLQANNGITIYLAMLVMGGALAVALSVSTIFVGEFKISSEAVNSLKAVYVADSAMEYTLYQTRPGGVYAYNGNTGVSTLDTQWGVLSSDIMNTVNHNNCPAGLPTGAVCLMEIKLIPKDLSAPPSCRDSSANDCTEVTARGSFGNINRAMEIVYPNL